MHDEPRRDSNAVVFERVTASWIVAAHFTDYTLFRMKYWKLQRRIFLSLVTEMDNICLQSSLGPIYRV
jgi:hypothetical protein